MIPLTRLYIRSSIFSSGFTVKILYVFPEHISCQTHLVNLRVLEVTNDDTHHYALFSDYFLPPLPRMT
jgi:hypothetical protein